MVLNRADRIGENEIYRCIEWAKELKQLVPQLMLEFAGYFNKWAVNCKVNNMVVTI